MKNKFLSILLIVGIMMSFTGCAPIEDFFSGIFDSDDSYVYDDVVDDEDEDDDDEDDDNDTGESDPKEKALAAGAFVKKVEGFWGWQNDRGGWEILSFQNGKMSDYTYQGHMWLYDGTIEKVEVLPDNIFKIKITYQDVVYEGDEEPAETHIAEYTFSTDDDFTNSLYAVGDNASVEYIYIGRTQEEAFAYIESTY